MAHYEKYFVLTHSKLMGARQNIAKVLGSWSGVFFPLLQYFSAVKCIICLDAAGFWADDSALCSANLSGVWD